MISRIINTLLLSFFLYVSASAQVPTTLNDFFLPGSQPLQSDDIKKPTDCDCHGNYDIAVEPMFNWKGSMMAQASRDALFYASLTIANQDAPQSGDLCLRCHTPKGWLEGRSTPTNGSNLLPEDRDGVLCHFCHKAIKPSPLGINPYPNDSNYTATTYPADQTYLAKLSPIPGQSANGMYIADSVDFRRGPYVNPAALHDFYYSPFHRESAICGTCHDVSNPVYSKDSTGNYLPNNWDQAAPDFDPYTLFPVERTYSEWLKSDYNTAQGVYAPQFLSNSDTVRTCDDCHMHDVTGKGCQQGRAPIRTDLGLHDFTGGNTSMPKLVAVQYSGEIDPVALDSGIQRATRMLQLAATLELTVIPQGSGFLASVKVTNETGHKLPSGYPEGRRIWINLKAFDVNGQIIYESGAYDSSTAVLTHDPDIKVYEIKPGISADIASSVGLPVGPSFHFVLNNTIFKDNRIPPRGFTNANFQAIQSLPVGYIYTDGQYWDITDYTLPATTDSMEVTLYYQTTSKEYVEFLQNENVTDNRGQTLYNLWDANGRSAPVAMTTKFWKGVPITNIEPLLNPVPDEYYLFQNFPNPFNPSTNIEFNLPKTGQVTLKVFNILGEEVATLVSDRLAAGSYSYEWEASDLASGVYLYRLQAGDYIETRKMVLMR